MKSLLPIALFAIITLSIASCKSSGTATPHSFCDTACLKDTMKFVKESNPLKPYVWITGSQCTNDSITLSYMGGNRRGLALKSMFGGDIMYLNPKACTVYIKDTSYIWVVFNDCATGHGYLIQLPFSTPKVKIKESAFNKFDPKYAVEDGLVAYSDKGNLLVENALNGKSEVKTFGQVLDIDWDHIHDYIDTVNITRHRIYAHVKYPDGWKDIEKNINLE